MARRPPASGFAAERAPGTQRMAASGASSEEIIRFKPEQGTFELQETAHRGGQTPIRTLGQETQPEPATATEKHTAHTQKRIIHVRMSRERDTSAHHTAG